MPPFRLAPIPLSLFGPSGPWLRAVFTLASKHVMHFDAIRTPGVFQHQLSRGLGREPVRIDPIQMKTEVASALFSPTGRLVESKPELQELPR